MLAFYIVCVLLAMYFTRVFEDEVLKILFFLKKIVCCGEMLPSPISADDGNAKKMF